MPTSDKPAARAASRKVPGSDIRIDTDAWLSSVFGHDVGRVTLDPDGNPPPTKAFQSEMKSPMAFFYARVPTIRVTSVSALVQAGFRVIDVNLTFERLSAQSSGMSTAQPGVRPGDAKPGSGDVLVRPAKPGDRAAILQIAETTFQFSRFHLDPNIPRTLANTVKKEWVANSLSGKRGNGVLVAETRVGLAGFLTLLASDAGGRKTGIIDLIAVAPNVQRRGIGDVLLNHFVNEAGRDYELLRVGTQAANIPSTRLYEKWGFRLADSAYILHAHVQNGTVS